MCDLFGLSCNKEDRATKSLPKFAEFSEINRHGWGIAHYKGDKAIVKRQPEKAKASKYFFEEINNTKSNVIISHIRYATKGEICERNCHPFKQDFHNKEWIFAHNGSVHGVENHQRSLGETDSEQVFNFLLDKISEYQSQGEIRGIYPGIVYGIKELFKSYGKNINLNFLMSDGNILYAFNHYYSKPIYLLKREKDYGGAILVSTQKLGNENWKKIPEDKLLLLEKGEIIVLSDDIKLT